MVRTIIGPAASSPWKRPSRGFCHLFFPWGDTQKSPGFPGQPSVASRGGRLRRQPAWLLVVSGAIATVLGCGPALQPVRGTVLLDGKPAPEGVRVIFSALGNTKQADGIVGADGRFELHTVEDRGIMPGRYVVLLLNSTRSVPVPTVEIQPGVNMPPPEWMAYDRAVIALLQNPPQGPGWIPIAYASRETSTLSFDVPGDGREAVFEVSSSAP